MSEQLEDAARPQQPEESSPVINVADQPVNQEPVTLKGVVEAYLENLAAGGTRPGTVVVYKKVLDLALAHLGAERRIDSITLLQTGKFYASDACNKFPDGRPKAEPTVKQIRRVFRQCMEFALSQGWISVLPIPKSEMEHARSKKSQPEHVIIASDEAMQGESAADSQEASENMSASKN